MLYSKYSLENLNSLNRRHHPRQQVAQSILLSSNIRLTGINSRAPRAPDFKNYVFNFNGYDQEKKEQLYSFEMNEMDQSDLKLGVEDFNSFVQDLMSKSYILALLESHF